jgi:hypothetical protein
VDYATVAGSAQPGSDFVGASGTFDWNDGDASDRSITIDLIDDELAETPEDFSLVLKAPTGGARLASSAATTNIQSTDGPGELALYWLQAVFGDNSVEEGIGAIQMSVARRYGSEGEISVAFRTNGGSATAGSDFASASGTLKWADGDSNSKTFEIRILEDALGEGTERFDVQIINPTGGATLSSRSRQNVFIVDNDPSPPPPPPPPPPPQPSGGGGGGTTGPELLALLGLLHGIAMYNRQLRRREIQPRVL